MGKEDGLHVVQKLQTTGHKGMSQGLSLCKILKNKAKNKSQPKAHTNSELVGTAAATRLQEQSRQRCGPNPALRAGSATGRAHRGHGGIRAWPVV